jgi:hypothetical protein
MKSNPKFGQQVVTAFAACIIGGVIFALLWALDCPTWGLILEIIVVPLLIFGYVEFGF